MEPKTKREGRASWKTEHSFMNALVLHSEMRVLSVAVLSELMVAVCSSPWRAKMEY